MNLLEAVKYTSVVRERQYSTGKVTAVDYKYLPREKQLYVNAQNISSDKKRLYKTILVFEGVTNSEVPDKDHPVPYSSKGHGVDLYLGQVTSRTRLRTRCQCQDYYFMWEYWNKGKKALVGPHKVYQRVIPPSGRPPVNPLEMPGLCKHLLALVKKLMADGVIIKDSTVWSYLTRPVRE
ncbi:hypothetical protein [Ralstonia phage RP13]|nr:hypothetical protein [Ralstonia phage RP13]